ncbi:hypothetical protein J2T57_000946 [Natronocella acetinitrilica]|uniref:DUF721 domain-containing protein n=1 Tax=Natronocella acetinitrilica TaxID=414046 RepID=A0AAE3G1U5_9GAMM|nr:hypothetical protein [Natronocella acetinitrilica]
MKTPKAKPASIGGLLAKGDKPLGRIASQARMLCELEKRIAESLPGDFHGRWQLAAVSNRQVVVTTTSAAWATQLRFSATEILGAVNARQMETGRVATRLVVKIAPPARLPTRPSPPRELSDSAGRHLQRAAETTTHQPLAEALRRLASRRNSGGGKT